MQFRPSLISTVVIGALVAGFLSLSQWQSDRAMEKDTLVSQFASAGEVTVLTDRSQPRFTRATLDGVFDTRRSFLVDNQVLNGRPGVHVLTPFRTREGTVLLVNRGWLGLPNRTTLPDVETPGGPLQLKGHLDGLQLPGMMLGEPNQVVSDVWPQLLTYPDLERMAEGLAENLYPQVLYLQATAPAGFEGRDWKPVVMTPARHRGYSLQWAALALTGVVAWVILGVMRGKKTQT